MWRPFSLDATVICSARENTVASPDKYIMETAKFVSFDIDETRGRTLKTFRCKTRKISNNAYYAAARDNNAMYLGNALRNARVTNVVNFS